MTKEKLEEQAKIEYPFYKSNVNDEEISKHFQDAFIKGGEFALSSQLGKVPTKELKSILDSYEQIDCHGETHIYYENALMAMHQAVDSNKCKIPTDEEVNELFIKQKGFLSYQYKMEAWKEIKKLLSSPSSSTDKTCNCTEIQFCNECRDGKNADWRTKHLGKNIATTSTDKIETIIIDEYLSKYWYDTEYNLIDKSDHKKAEGSRVKFRKWISDNLPQTPINKQ